jgi:cold shock CspA family protein
MVRLGVVAAFDEARGLGIVRDGEGGEELGFHCTEIADGTRTIEVGTPVAFVAVAARLGRREARGVRPLG